MTVASVAPAVLRICIWIWSYVIVSVQERVGRDAASD
jgi:hypothetical protein